MPTNAAPAYVKLFPAADLGVNYVKAIRAPLSHIKLLAVGGVNEKNFADFLKVGMSGAGVGGNLANNAWSKPVNLTRSLSSPPTSRNCTQRVST